MPITDAHPDIEREITFFPVCNQSPRKLAPEQIRHFNKKGYVFPLDVFSPEEIAAHRAYFDRLLKKVMAKGHNSYSINGWQKYCGGIHDLATEPRILDYVEDLLGPNIVCWGAHFFCKMMGDAKQVSWHQDASYWPLTPSKAFTVWLAIDDVDDENGAMRVIPGSHLHGQIPFEHSKAEENNVLGQTVPDIKPYGDEPVAFEMHAGQISLHTDLLLHGSQPNRSKRRRCGLSMRFVPPEVRAYKGRNRGSIICRGSDASGHWNDVPRPKVDVIPELRPKK